jgi:hypothetical protein
VNLVSIPGKTSTDSKLYYGKLNTGRSYWSAPSSDALNLGWYPAGTIVAYYKWSSDGSWIFATGPTGRRVYLDGNSISPYTPPAPQYFGTYIDVNLSKQKVLYISNGVVKLTTDVVTGKPSTPTPAGTFYILYKQSPAVLVGADYAAPVTFWMPFTSVGHGFHDANWQSAFGGNRYLIGFGSHGCVNMPYWAAAELYRMAPTGSRVSIHW